MPGTQGVRPSVLGTFLAGGAGRAAVGLALWWRRAPRIFWWGESYGALSGVSFA